MQTTNETLVTDVLASFFSGLKDAGYKTAFICGTDVMTYINNRNFLINVDFHIDTDILYLYMTSILYHVKAACESHQLHDMTFIFDDYFMVYDGGAKFYEAIDRIFLPYLLQMYGVARHGDCDYLRNDLGNRNIYIIYPDSGYNFYYDWVRNNEQIVDILTQMQDSNFAYAIGRSTSSDWFEYIKELSQDKQMEAYIYNRINYGYDIYLNRSYDFQGDIHNSGSVNLTSLAEMLNAFTNNEDLSTYNNRNGACIVTHKFPDDGDDDWMIDGLIGECWQTVMSENEYNYYYE